MKESLLSFDKEYFKGETLWGYYVSPFFKRMHAAQMEVLAEVDRVCKKHNIEYFIDWGTLLGAVRHGGFIPWDDDIDISMRREEYSRFVEVAKTEFLNFSDNRDTDYDEMEGKLLYTNPFVSDNWHQSFSVVRNYNRNCIRKDFLKKYHGCPIPVGIDIFPLDYMPEDDEDTEFIYSFVKLMEGGVYVPADELWTTDFKPKTDEAKKLVTLVEEITGRKMNHDLNYRNQLARLIDESSHFYSRSESRYIMTFVWYAFDRTRKPRFEKYIYDEIIELNFDGMLLPAPKNYDAILKGYYGDYMIPNNYSSETGYHTNEALAKLIEESGVGKETMFAELEKAVSEFL